MNFECFIHSPKGIAMVITVAEYRRIKPLLQEFYSARDIERIDDYCEFTWANHRFLLCNIHEKNQIGTPIMLEDAVTFVDRVPFKNIVFDTKE